MGWKDLNITQKAELIKLGIRSGIKDINQIRQLYDNVDIKDYQHPYYTNKTVPKDNIQSQNQDNTLIKGMIDDFNRNKHNIPQQNIYSQNKLGTERIDNQNQTQFQQFKGGGYISNNSSMSLVGEVRKYKEGGYEDEDENTIYTAGYSEPINIKASRKLSKRQQMQADEEWRNYLATHPIQIGSEEYNRLPEKARAQVVKNSVTNAINKAALPTAATIIAPTALAAGAASLVGSGALTTVADAAGKVGTKIASTGIGQAAKNFITNPYVDYALTIDGIMHIPSYIRNGVDKVKNKEYLNALGDFSLAALEGFGMANMPNNVSKIHDDIYNIINNYPELIEKGKNYFNRVTAPITSIKHTPYTGDHLALAKERMINGGFDKLGIDDYLEITVPKSNPLHKLGDFQESNSNYELLQDIEKTEFNSMKELLEQRLKYDVNTRKYLMGMEPVKDPTHPLIQEGNAFYTRREKQMYTPMVGEYAQFNRDIPHIVDAHEWQHAVDDLGNIGHNYSKEEMDLLNKSVDFSKFDKNVKDYLRNYTEQHARLAQIKNYFGITDPNAPVTEDMWNYARRHYVKDTGMDNNMQQFFRAVKDPKTYLSVMNGKVAGATGVGLLGLKASQQNDDKEYSRGGYIFPNNVFQHKFAEGGNPDGEDVILIEPDTTVDALNIDTSRYDRNYQIDPKGVIKVNDINEILNAKPEYVVPKGNAENTYAAKVNEHNNKNSSREREARLESLKSKSEEEIKEIQRQYADQGFYDFELKTGKSKEARTIQKRLAKEEYISYKDIDGNIGSFTTKALQQMLIEKGYLPEFNEYGRPNKDGIIGKRTREAFKQYNRDYNVDGIAGTLTENIYLQGNKQTIVSAEGMQDQCAKWVSKQFETNVGNTKQNGVFGNAWNMLHNIKDQGGEILFNLYEDPAFDSVTTGRGVINNVDRLLQSTDMNSLYSQLQVNDVVGIHMPSSSHFKDVLDGGTTYNTHVGIVTGFKNGVPIISHNIGGKVKTEPINNLTGSTWGKPSVTVASRPKNSSNVAQELVFDNTIKSNLHVPEGKENNLMSEYMDSLAQSKQTFKDIYTGVDMDFIEKASIGITGVETNFMNTKQSDLRKKGNPQALLRSAAHWVRQTNEEVKSQDLTKMKFNTLSSEYRKSIGLTSPEQLSEDPTVTGRAVFLTLCKYYDYFQRLAKENPKLGLTKQDIENATILSYNRGFASTHTLGFDKQGFGTPEELEYLRKAGEIGSREKDISSTNYKYLGDLGEKLYNKAFPEGSLTYVGRVRGYMEKI